MNEKYIFSAPGRTELGGNHTDHQHGCVLAAAVNLETVAEVELNSTSIINIRSEGFPDTAVDLTDLAVHKAEYGTTSALVRGVAAGFSQRGAALGGFNASVKSSVLSGSGLSSSAAFEVLVGTILNELFFDKSLSAVEIAQISQYAENVYFGKPCGLMDQMASSVGGIVAIDFENTDSPKVEKISFDLESTGYSLCIIDSGADHSELTDEYSAITDELKSVCAFFNKSYLREIDESDFTANLRALRQTVSDRAVLRAIHVFEENKRVMQEVNALKTDNFEEFLRLVTESGQSSWMYLQNVMPCGAVNRQEVAVALALCRKFLDGRGAYRVHGGGFAGTVQAFVPNDMTERFKGNIEAVLGEGACHVLKIRDQGGIRVK